MKYIKSTLLLIAVLLFTQSFAQDTVSKLTFETRYQLRKDSSYVPNLQFRYFVNEKGALRIGGAYQYSSVTREVHESGGEGVGTVEKLSNLFMFSVGYERHFKRNNVSPYFGGELNLGIGKIEEYGYRTDSVSFIPGLDYSSKVPTSQFGVHLFSGVDIYLFENLYIGTEFGFQFMKKDLKRGEFKSENSNSTTEPEIIENIPSVSTKSFDLVNAGVIRVGWRF